MQRLSKIKKILRLRKKKEHRAVRAIKMIFSRFRKHGRRKLRVLKLWKKRKLYKVERRIRRVVKKRTRYSKTLRQLSLRSITNLLIKTTKAKEILEKSIKSTREKTVLLTPLHFKKPANQLTASTEENKKWKRHVQAMQKQKYGRLENVSGALTKILPNIISMLLEKNKTKLTKTQTKQAIVAAYWNLRLLIQQAYRSKKFSVTDLNPAKLVRLKQELTVRARCQFFDMSAVKKTRYRFQPHRLITAPSLKRGAEDWIRQYLPKFYDLYLEDAEKYKHLMITPIKIFRAHPNRAAIRSWETRANPSTIEAQFKRLTQGARGRSSNRFENMLITARRHPLINGREHAASASVLTGTNSQPRWNSFFKRDYGSYLQQNRKVANRVVSVLKWMPLDENREAPRGLLTAYKLVKSRNVAKSKIRHISENETEINGVVDFRLSRQKSPRNSEFIERLADHSNQVHEKTFLSYKESVRKKILKTLNAEKSSRTTKIATHAEPAFLHKVRKQAMTRRSATFVKNKKLASEKFIPPVEQKDLTVTT